MNRIVMIAALLVLPLCVKAQTDTVYISKLYTTHIVFSTDLTYADLSNQKDIAAKIVDQNRNMLAVRARGEFSSTASISALESNGAMHTYILQYCEHPENLVIDTRKEAGDGVSNLRSSDAPLLKDVIEMPQGVFHLFERENRVELTCENIFSYSDITYVTLALNNRSGVSYETGDATFIIESRNKGKRKIVYEQNIYPKNRFGTLTTAAKQSQKIAYSLDKITLAPDQVLRIYVYETGGQRNLVLTLSPKDVNLAKRPR